MDNALEIVAARSPLEGDPIPFDIVLLSWAERCAAQGTFTCVHGDVIIVPHSVSHFCHGTRLVTADGRHVEIIAAEEDLTEIVGPALDRWERLLRDNGIPFQRETIRLLFARQSSIEEILRLNGATMHSVSEPFEPET